MAQTDNWDLVADVVIIGAGATGLPAAIVAADAGASVIVVEANYDVGGHAIIRGHAIISGGNVPLGGGTSAQKKYGIKDSPETVFSDLTDWSIVQPNGSPDYRYNDRAVMRAFADNCAPTYEFLLENGVEFKDIPPDNLGAHSIGNSAPRENHAFWDKGAGLASPSGRPGTGVIRPLEASARAKGVKFLLNHQMTSIVREQASGGKPGRVTGITAEYRPRILPGETEPLKSYRSEGNIEHTEPTVSVRAAKAVIVATGGSTGNVNFRRMFDPRLHAVYQVAGEPWTLQDASGELAGMAIGASLWGLVNQTLENGDNIRVRRAIGARWNYFAWDPKCPILPLCGATGLAVKNWHDLILVNQVGKRFYDETKGDYPEGNKYGDVDPYVPGSYHNAHNIEYDANTFNFFNAAVAMNEGSQPPDYEAGPVWAIFDADAVEREGWKVTHKEPFSAGGHGRRNSGSHGCPLQFVRGLGNGRGLRQGEAAVQDSKTPVLCGVGYSAGARFTRGAPHQREVPGHGHERPGDTGSVLRWRVGRRLQSARARQMHHPGVHLRSPCGSRARREGVGCRINVWTA